MRSVSLRMCLVIVTLAAPLHAGDRIFDASTARACFASLLHEAGWGLAGPWERAAFVVAESGGRIDCVDWPWKHFYLEETFRGVMPQGTIAVVHTHPVAFPLPSEADVEEAQHIGKPIYVLSIHGVYKVDPRSRAVSRLANDLSWIHPLAGPAVASAGGSR